MKILVVEDEEFLRRMMLQILHKNGFQVAEAADGEKALEILRNDQEIDIAILDIMLPGMDGISVLEAVRQDPAISDKEVVMCSCLSDMNTVLKAKEAGISGYIVKPFVEQDIMDRIKPIVKQLLPVLEDPDEICGQQDIKRKEYESMLTDFGEQAEKSVAAIGALLGRGAGPSLIEEEGVGLLRRAGMVGALRLKNCLDEMFRTLNNEEMSAVLDAFKKVERETGRLKTEIHALMDSSEYR